MVFDDFRDVPVVLTLESLLLEISAQVIPQIIMISVSGEVLVETIHFWTIDGYNFW